MKIALLNGTQIPTPPPAYGSEIVTYWLASALAAAGQTVHLIAPEGSTAPPGVTLHYVPRATAGAVRAADVVAWTWYADLLRACDVIHDLSGTVAVVEEAYLDNPEAPTLYTRNGIDFSHPRFARHNAVVLSEAARRAAQTGTSAWAATPWAAQYAEHPGRLADPAVVPYGIDTAWYTPGSGAGGYVLYVGRPHPAKGLDVLLAAAHRCPDQRFVFAWRPWFADHAAGATAITQAVAGLPNVEIVTLPLVGHHEAKRRLYQEAALFVSPNRYTEAFGLTAVEALACGTPVVLGANGAGPEIVQDPAYGAVLDANAPDAVDQLVAILRDPPRDRAAARRRATEAYDRQRMAADYLRLYAAVVEGRWWNP